MDVSAMTGPLAEEPRARDDAGYLIVDHEWRVLAADDRAALAADQPEALIGQNARDVLGPDVVASLAKHGAASFSFGAMAYVLTVNTFALPWGEIRVVRAQEEQATLERMLSLVVHEVRNPLSAMRTLAQGLEEALPLSETGRDYIARLTDEIDRLGRLLNTMSQVARLRAEPMSLISPATSLERVAAMFQLNAAQRNVAIITHVTPRAGAIRADPDQIQQALVNLVTNALQAMPDGGTLTLRARLDARGRTVIQVEDTGVGMTTEALRRASQPGQSTKPGGMGLGLMVVRGIARQHQAQMRIASAPGRGSVVSITFPLVAELAESD
jgi:two-component system, NtrC family, sensor histidine kinase HydH